MATGSGSRGLSIGSLLIGVATISASCLAPTPSGTGASGGKAGAATGGATTQGTGGSGATASGGAPGAGGAVGSSGGAGTASGGDGGAPAATGGAGGRGTGGAAGGGAGGRAGSGTGGTGTAGSSGTAMCPTTATAKPGETSQSITVGGRSRTFIRHIPTGYTGQTPVPVVIDFHPLGGTGSGWKGSGGWGTLADRQGFIVIWPDGIGNSWNAGRCCRTALEEKIDDVAFAKAIVTTLAKDACIDAKRVYATGCSNGGGMAFKVACDAADVFAAVAPVDFDCVTSAADNDRTCGTTCKPARPISEIQFRGTGDSAVPYEGGLRDGGTTTFPGAEQTFMSFASINMCTGSPQALSGHAACKAYGTCGGGAETVLCTVQNGTHCGSYQSFGIVNIAWELFQRHSLP